ncbi:MAG: methylenetetrahydrofolate--tRNA-(uracil(54)-C(5))-methyltransferase (FADH(2)-oxidizing) TrmFO [Candidatus Tokpelaia sp.]|nr:MAG: methylenetetrahydrofolate--tRNA-(uracil(54)-C(5))-methyltransferase (FADH(2)-oxidizing) TrmFO [Candidatus Tokpelaia sp.]KAA6205326.1 MAG: methylenetetrahydrofolate--tRNA-(uracil(54)-C(5))-methyltransferase (FADH(2)-oxidizing) TrmFO [Candidatus Tokpelaia sp.]
MAQKQTEILHIIGGGLAGSEAAFQAANAGIKVILYEMRPHKMTQAHKSGALAELVCSNSFRSDDSSTNAVGLLHAEMRLADSLIMQAADANQVPAGSALAVDREGFAQAVSARIAAHPNIRLECREVEADFLTEALERNYRLILATGPLTSPALAAAIQQQTGEDSLAFFDAIAPIIYKDSINMDIAWFQSRYDKQGPGGTGRDYLNCPLNKAQYEAFIAALLAGEKTEFRTFEKTGYFDGCLPVEIMAERGAETLRFGPMKPRGLTNAHKPQDKPYAVVQLRQDNKLGTLYNMVGFQTKLKHGEQTRIFRMIPGLAAAEFARLGGLHRNSYLNSPVLLDSQLCLKTLPNWRFAGQITGCEGYVESAAMGLLAGRFAAAELGGRELAPPPASCAFGALLNHITGGHISAEAEIEVEAEAEDQQDKPAQGRKPRSFQPMNINFGLFPPVNLPEPAGQRQRGKEKTQAKKQALSARALQDWQAWLAEADK